MTRITRRVHHGKKIAKRGRRVHSKKSRKGKRRSRTTKKRRASRKGRKSRRRLRGGELYTAYGAPVNGVSNNMLPNPHMAYTGVMKGGMNENVVKPFVGNAWGSQPETWPGVSGAHEGNYLAKNSYDVQPEMEAISERNTTQVMRGGDQYSKAAFRKSLGKASSSSAPVPVDPNAKDFINAYSGGRKRRGRKSRKGGDQYSKAAFRKSLGSTGTHAVPVHVDPNAKDFINAYSGGRKRRGRKSRKQKGGFFGMGLNVWPQLQHDISSGYRTLTGQPHTPNPLPYEDQMFYGNRAEDNLNYLKVKIN